MLPMLAITPLPRNSGQATVRESSTERKPGGPARSVLSQAPEASAVARKNIRWRRTNERISGFRWSQHLVVVEPVRAVGAAELRLQGTLAVGARAVADAGEGHGTGHTKSHRLT